MALLNGNDFTLVTSTSSSGHLAFAHSTDASLSFSNSLVEATLGVTGGWVEFISGKKSANISFSGLNDFGTIVDRLNTEDLAEYLLDEEEIYFQIGDNSRGAYAYGKGYISEITLEGGHNEASTYSGVLTVTKEIDQTTLITTENLQDSDGNDILSDDGTPLQAKIFR